ncbi:hypothetical protein HPB51_027840 [Rhipicephalus microplus]|uniref:Uncharacterized protein n=1 Tax=Rhipicephalus microplus TaxID=6941 RepID=A0A9J6CYS5_RHIMP|nr:hypothetical protein HPB51_027840 [Rhipicephalus microplus]
MNEAHLTDSACNFRCSPVFVVEFSLQTNLEYALDVFVLVPASSTKLSMHGASMSVTSPVLDVPAEATAQAATLVSTETPQVALASCTVPEDVVMEIDGLFTPLKALPLQRPPSTIVNASIAYIAGFVAKAVEERRTCTFCPSLHQSDGSSPVLMGLISLKSRGGLTFPKPEFVMVLVTIKKAVDIALPHIKKSNVRQQLAELILPHLE